MKQYESYKPSGTLWIGDIPSHWEVMKIAHLYNFIGSGTTPATGVKEYYDESGINWLQTGDLSDGAIYGTSKHISLLAKKELNLKLYPEGSLVVAMYGATVGKLGLLNVPTTVNQACCVLVNSKRLYNKFSFYSFLAAQKSLIVLSTGGGQPNISQDIIRNHHTIVPPIDEQVAIADYLDRKCESIDKVIAIQERRVVLLTELKQSIITEAVTRGLNPNVPLKESDIDWIGQIPEHWEKCRFKNFMVLITTPSTSNNKIGLENIESCSGKFIETISEFDGNGIFFKSGHIVYGKLRPYLRKVWLAEFEGNAVGDFFVFETKPNTTSSFVKYLLLSDGFTQIATSATEGAKMPRVSSETILSLSYCLPPLEEQSAIVDYLEKKCSRIDSAISKAKREIELLREFKQSVITEAVTGKIKVC